MSLYAAAVGNLKIKPELQKDFSHLYNEQYDKITDPFLRDFARWFSDENKTFSLPLQNFRHENEKPEWKDIQTSYENGTFIYGISYNLHGRIAGFMLDFQDLLEYISKETIFEDHWMETS